MSDEKNRIENEELTAFEADLAALRPRADELDSRRRTVLANEAAQRGPLSLREKTKTGPLSLREKTKTGPLSLWERARVRAVRPETLPACPNPSGHQFACVYCGIDAPSARAGRRWAWPAALAAMTGVAAVLLAMLATPSGSKFAQDNAAPVADKAEQGFSPENRLAYVGSAHSRLDFGEEDGAYLKLRNQVLREGVESWKSPVSAFAAPAAAAEVPMSYREQLQQLLRETNHAS
jgi:hypothetical protein